MNAASALAPAVGLSLALGVVLMTGPHLGQYDIVVMLVVCLFLGLCTASLPSVPLSLVAAPALVLLMSGTLFAVKLLRMPQAPLTGDGFEILMLLYVATGVLGAIIGRFVRPWVRALS